MSVRLLIEVLASARQAKAEFASLDKSTATMGDKLSKLRGPATVALAGIGALRGQEDPTEPWREW